MTPEQRVDFDDSLEDLVAEIEQSKTEIERLALKDMIADMRPIFGPPDPEGTESSDEETEDEEGRTIIPYNPFEMPAGWTPPGWLSDDEAFRNAQSFMGWQATGPKGGK